MSAPSQSATTKPKLKAMLYSVLICEDQNSRQFIDRVLVGKRPYLRYRYLAVMQLYHVKLFVAHSILLLLSELINLFKLNIDSDPATSSNREVVPNFRSGLSLDDRLRSKKWGNLAELGRRAFGTMWLKEEWRNKHGKKNANGQAVNFLRNPERELLALSRLSNANTGNISTHS